MKAFALCMNSKENQLNLHFNNMKNTFNYNTLINSWNFINSIGFSYDYMLIFNQDDKLCVALYNMMLDYGWDKVNNKFEELCQELEQLAM